MVYTLLTTGWNADPNATEVILTAVGNMVTLEFGLNYFLYDGFKEGDRAKLMFVNCLKYAFSNTNDEACYKGQHRYRYTDLPWGEFYKLSTNWETDFPKKHIQLCSIKDKDLLNHYIFFFRDNTFECVAEDYQLAFLRAS